MTDTAPFLTIITVVISCGVLLSTCEWLYNWRALTVYGTLSWDLLQGRRWIWSRRWMIRLANPFLMFPNVLAVLLLRVLAAILLIGFASDDVIRPIALTLIVGSTLAMNIRSFPLGFTGADRMATIVLGGLWLRELAPNSALATHSCLWFIALQCCLSYVTAGTGKLFSCYWRNGKAMEIISGNSLLGNEFLASVLNRNPVLSSWLTWSVIGLQITFPIALVAGVDGCAMVLSVAFLFHLSTGLLMGLNNFVWAWASSYPAVLFVAVSIEHAAS